jgi:hypothetical protein
MLFSLDPLSFKVIDLSGKLRPILLGLGDQEMGEGLAVEVASEIPSDGGLNFIIGLDHPDVRRLAPLPGFPAITGIVVNALAFRVRFSSAFTLMVSIVLTTRPADDLPGEQPRLLKPTP